MAVNMNISGLRCNAV